jgi:hypothetical protein
MSSGSKLPPARLGCAVTNAIPDLIEEGPTR